MTLKGVEVVDNRGENSRTRFFDAGFIGFFGPFLQQKSSELLQLIQLECGAAVTSVCTVGQRKRAALQLTWIQEDHTVTSGIPSCVT